MPNEKVQAIVRFVSLASRQKALVVDHEIVANVPPEDRQVLLRRAMRRAQQGHVRRVDSGRVVARGQVQTVVR